MKLILTNSSLSEVNFRIEQLSDDEVRLRLVYDGSYIRLKRGDSAELRGRRNVLLTALPLKDPIPKKETA